MYIIIFNCNTLILQVYSYEIFSVLLITTNYNILNELFYNFFLVRILLGNRGRGKPQVSPSNCRVRSPMTSKSSASSGVHFLGVVYIGHLIHPQV